MSSFEENIASAIKEVTKFAPASDDAKKAIEALAKALIYGSKTNAVYTKTIEDAYDVQKQMRDGTKRTSEAYNKLTEVYKAHIKEATKELNRISEENNLRKMIAQSIEANAKSYTTLGESIKKATGFVTTWAGKLGATALTFDNAKTMLLGYNQTMFEFSRTQQVAGKGMGNLGKAFDQVAKKTTLSRAKFAEFMNTAASGWKGIAPTSNALANLATNIQARFGPSVEKTNQVLKTFLDLQNQFPAMAETIANAMQKMGSNQPFDEKRTIAQIAAMRAAGIITKDVALTSVQMLTRVTKEQEKQVASNKAVAKVTQNSENAVLSMAQAIEGPLTGVTNQLAEIIGKLSEMPMRVLGVQAAFALLGKTRFSNMIIPKLGNIFKSGTGGGMSLPAGMFGSVSGTGGKFGKVGGFLSGGMGKLAGMFGKGNAMKVEVVNFPGVVSGKGGQNGGMGIGGSLIAIAIAAKVGWEIGKFLDKTFGISDRWSAIGNKITPLTSSSDPMLQRGAAAKKVNQARREKEQEPLKIAEAYQAALANYKISAEYNQKNVDLLKEQVSLMAEMGTIGEGMGPKIYAPIIKSLEMLRNETSNFMQVNNLGLMKIMEDLGVSMDKAREKMKAGDIIGSVTEVANEAQKKLTELSAKKLSLTIDVDIAEKGGDTEKSKKLQEELNKVTSEHGTIQVNLNTLQEMSTKEQKVQVDLAKQIRDSRNIEEKQAVELNSIAEQRLQTERDVMEAAQFGMGASITMMQKQVDMAYQLMEVEKERIDRADKDAYNQMKLLGLGDQQAAQAVDAIKNATTFMEARKIIKSVAGDEVHANQVLNGVYQDQQDATNKILQQQKKIYDITKNVREGYLDAIREMSSGAGEFEKIIGTQEMGVTQLMDAVENATGQKGVLNTMKLGGKQDEQLTAQGVGTSITGRYSAKGSMLSFLQGQGGPDSTELRNKRLFGWQESMDTYNKMQKGSKDENGAPKVGSGQVDERYLRPYQEEKKLQVEATEEGTKPVVDAVLKLGDAFIKGSTGHIVGGQRSNNIMGPVNRQLLDRRYYNPNETQVAGASSSLGAGLLNRSQGQAAAPSFINLPSQSSGWVVDPKTGQSAWRPSSAHIDTEQGQAPKAPKPSPHTPKVDEAKVEKAKAEEAKAKADEMKARRAKWVLNASDSTEFKQRQVTQKLTPEEIKETNKQWVDSHYNINDIFDAGDLYSKGLPSFNIREKAKKKAEEIVDSDRRDMQPALVDKIVRDTQKAIETLSDPVGSDKEWNNQLTFLVDRARKQLRDVGGDQVRDKKGKMQSSKALKDIYMARIKREQKYSGIVPPPSDEMLEEEDKKIQAREAKEAGSYQSLEDHLWDEQEKWGKMTEEQKKASIQAEAAGTAGPGTAGTATADKVYLNLEKDSQFIRDNLTDVKQKKGIKKGIKRLGKGSSVLMGDETDADYQKRKETTLRAEAIALVTTRGAAAWEDMTPQQINQYEKAATLASKKEKTKKENGAATGTEISQIGLGRGAPGSARNLTSGAEARIGVTSEADQASMASGEGRASAASVWGASAGESGGSGYGKIEVELSPELTGKIIAMEKMLIEINTAAKVKS